MLFNGKKDNSDFFFVFRSAITLKEFLDIIEIAFITEVNMRRSVVPSAVVSLVTMLCKIIWLFNSYLNVDLQDGLKFWQLKTIRIGEGKGTS